MPHRKLVQIGKAPKLPTVSEFFRALADRQGEDIRRLKEAAAAKAKIRPKVAAKKQAKKTVLAEGWRLHPTVGELAPAPAKPVTTKKHRVATKSHGVSISQKEPARAGTQKKRSRTLRHG